MRACRNISESSYTDKCTYTLASTAPHPAHRKFPYLNVLNASVTRANEQVFVEIKALSLKEHEGVATIKGTVEPEDGQKADAWVESLLAKAYSESVRYSRRALQDAFLTMRS